MGESGPKGDEVGFRVKNTPTMVSHGQIDSCL
jgi:hypothetical protein